MGRQYSPQKKFRDVLRNFPTSWLCGTQPGAAAGGRRGGAAVGASARTLLARSSSSTHAPRAGELHARARERSGRRDGVSGPRGRCCLWTDRWQALTGDPCIPSLWRQSIGGFSKLSKPSRTHGTSAPLFTRVTSAQPLGGAAHVVPPLVPGPARTPARGPCAPVARGHLTSSDPANPNGWSSPRVLFSASAPGSGTGPIDQTLSRDGANMHVFFAGDNRDREQVPSPARPTAATPGPTTSATAN
jgi:hypothetical protein